MTRGVRRWLFAGAGLAAALVVARILWPGGGAAAQRGRLEPLAGLVRGRWLERDAADSPSSSEFRWGAEGRSLRETARDADGEVVGETLYFWHPAGTPEGGSLALLGLLADGTVRDGILREDEEGSLELRWNAFDPEGGGGSYRERIRFLDADRIVRSLHRKTTELEILVEERTFVRARR